MVTIGDGRFGAWIAAILYRTKTANREECWTGALTGPEAALTADAEPPSATDHLRGRITGCGRPTMRAV